MFVKAMFISVVSLAMAPVVALAQHGEEKGKPAEFKMPTTYKAGVEEIEHRLDVISKLMESKQLAKVHVEADVIQKVAKEIGQLALKEGSSVPKEAVKDIDQAGKDLAGKFDAIDKSADAGDAAGTKKIYDEMVKIAATLAKYTPKTYQCPMKCEREKTYDKLGKCPKCGMDLKGVKSHVDHEAEHEGH
jgi:PHP family Zn ribbon phosphoesterase